MQETLLASSPRQPKKAVQELVDFFAGKQGIDLLKKNFQENSICFVAGMGDMLTGVARGRKDYLLGLFIRPSKQGQGIGETLLQRFEQECQKQGSRYIRTHAFVESVAFYQKHGYKKTTGVRYVEGFRTQPMKKMLN